MPARRPIISATRPLAAAVIALVLAVAWPAAGQEGARGLHDGAPVPADPQAADARAADPQSQDNRPDPWQLYMEAAVEAVEAGDDETAAIMLAAAAGVAFQEGGYSVRARLANLQRVYVLAHLGERSGFTRFGPATLRIDLSAPDDRLAGIVPILARFADAYYKRERALGSSADERRRREFLRHGAMMSQRHVVALRQRLLDSDKDGLANAFANLGVYHYRRGELDLAVDAVRNALDYWQRSESYHSLGRHETLGVADMFVGYGNFGDDRASNPVSARMFLARVLAYRADERRKDPTRRSRPKDVSDDIHKGLKLLGELERILDPSLPQLNRQRRFGEQQVAMASIYAQTHAVAAAADFAEPRATARAGAQRAYEAALATYLATIGEDDPRTRDLARDYTQFLKTIGDTARAGQLAHLAGPAQPQAR